MNQDKDYLKQEGFPDEDLQNSDDSVFELEEYGEEGSKFSLLSDNRPENDLGNQMPADDNEIQEIFDSLDIRANKTTKIEDFQSSKKEKNLKDAPLIYEKLTKNLLKCSEKWFDIDQKLKELNEFDELFLKTFEFSYYYERKSKFIRKNFNNSKRKNLIDQSKKQYSIVKSMIYDPQIDEIFINSKDVYIDIEISLKFLYVEVMDELWTHISEVCEAKNLNNEYLINSEQIDSNEQKTKRLIIEKVDTPYKIILRPTKALKKNLNFIYTSLYSTYAKVDDRFRILAAFLTIWGNKRGLLSKGRFLLNDLYNMLIFFFLQNQILPSLQTDFKVPEKKIEILKKSHKNDQEKWCYTLKPINFAFEEDLIKIKTVVMNREKPNFTVGELLPKFFYFFGVELPKTFEECQTRESNQERQKYVILNAKNGKSLFFDFNYEIECVALKKGLGDRKEIDKGFFILDPFLGNVTTKHLIGRLNRENVLNKIKEFVYDNPYEDIEVVFRNHNYEKVEIEFYVAYKRIMVGNGRDIFDDVDFKNWGF